ncbi:hypothetical protein [Streptomyces avermitilis]|uniref:hypothetical protein n=1 Tax=Streptomyces avermitilis TaxID=33903 RepID=UPI00381DF483
MSGIYFHIRLKFPTEETVRQWKELALLVQRDHLEATPGFDAINMGDDDLLGGEITVRQQTELDAAIAYLHQVGFPVDKSRIVEWKRTVSDGEPAVWFAEAGTLPRSAKVSDLLAHLQSPGIAGGLVESPTTGDTAVVIHGFLPDYDTYREYRLPMIYAGSAASQLGGRGTVSFLGPSDGEYVVTFADFDGASIEIFEPDPQDLIDEELSERFDSMDWEGLYHAWKAQ